MRPFICGVNVTDILNAVVDPPHVDASEAQTGIGGNVACFSRVNH
jgi:hypothetical protein